MCDGLFGLRHDGIVGCDDDDGDIGNLSTTGTHGCEGFVTRSIEEGDTLATLQLDVVGTDVLGDTTRLTCDDVRIAYIVEE